MKKIIGLGLLIVLCTNPITAMAAEHSEPAVISVESENCYDFDDPDDYIEETNELARGTKPPTSSWDLGSNDYSVQFVMNSAIFTNVLFKNHSGEIYLNITNTSSEDTALICELYAEGKDPKNDDMPATSATIDTNGSWNVKFYNLNTETSYYVRFVKVHDEVDVTGKGIFSINEIK